MSAYSIAELSKTLDHHAPYPNGRIMISATTWNRQSRIWSNYLFFSSPTIIIQY